MDPFSITVGVVSLIALTAQTMKVTRTYVHEVKHGKEAAAELLRELDVLHYNLSQLDAFLKSDEAARPFDSTSVLVTSTFACRDKLTVLVEKLSGASGSLLNRLKWPLDSKEHRQTVQDLRAFAQWVQFALTIDGCALLSKTSADVLETLASQLETIQLVKGVDQRTRTLEHSLENQAKEAKSARVAEEREKILHWVSAAEPEQKHHDVRIQRMDGTGEWLLQDKKFQRWRDEPGSSNNVLWCHGIQGSGKSVLASLVIDRLRDNFFAPDVAIAHLYFDYRDQERQSTENMTASVLKQLAMAKVTLPQPLTELHQRLKGQQRKPQQQDLEQTMLATLQEFDRVFIIIDAVDECDFDMHRTKFLEFLKFLRQKTSVSLCITSRPYLKDVRKIFEDCAQITIKADDADLRKFISGEIERSGAAEDIDEDFRKDIIEKIVFGARHMFLLAVLQVKAILNEPSAGEMEDALESMPHGLNDAFEETLQRIQKQPRGRRKLAMRTLMWISHARRPLKVEELSEALAINLKPGGTTSNRRYWQSQRMMVASCLGLVTVDQKRATIRLVHYSVQEYFREHQARIFPSGERTIAEDSITYLLYDDFLPGPCTTRAEIEVLIRNHPFARYAARYWGFHVREVDDDAIDITAMKLLQAAPQRNCSIQISQYSRGRREQYCSAEESNSRNGLHIAAGFGLDRISKELIESGQYDVDSASKMGTTALIEAAAAGHQALLRMLLHKRVDLSRQNWYGTAIHCAAESGQLVSISELLSAGLNVDIRDSSGRTALHCATISGHPRAMQLLLDQGAQVDALTQQGYTSLRYAVLFESPLEVIELLLSYGADTEIMNKSGLTLLHYAAEMDLEEIVVLLLEFGANANTQRHANGVTPLHLAAKHNHVTIVQTLIDYGGDVNTMTQYGVSPLYCAAKYGSGETVMFLLTAIRELAVDAADDEGFTPLHIATKENHIDIVRMLLDLGKADVIAWTEEGRSALDFAFERRNDSIVSLLLKYGAVKQAGDQKCWVIGEEGMSPPSDDRMIKLADEDCTMAPSRQTPIDTDEEGQRSAMVGGATLSPSIDLTIQEVETRHDPKEDLGADAEPHPPPLARKRYKGDSCRLCSRMKFKCDEGRPLCSSCKKSGRHCTYPTTPARNKETQHSQQQPEALPSPIPKATDDEEGGMFDELEYKRDGMAGQKNQRQDRQPEPEALPIPVPKMMGVGDGGIFDERKFKEDFKRHWMARQKIEKQDRQPEPEAFSPPPPKTTDDGWGGVLDERLRKEEFKRD